jgi:type I restriction enzyme R subunit
LALLNAEPAFARMRRDVEAIAGALAEKDAIPMALILDVLTDPFWQDVTTPILENVFPSPSSNVSPPPSTTAARQ